MFNWKVCFGWFGGLIGVLVFSFAIFRVMEYFDGIYGPLGVIVSCVLMVGGLGSVVAGFISATPELSKEEYDKKYNCKCREC